MFFTQQSAFRTHAYILYQHVATATIILKHDEQLSIAICLELQQQQLTKAANNNNININSTVGVKINP
jgi:hypothetical protein